VVDFVRDKIGYPYSQVRLMAFTYQRYSNLYQARDTSEQHLPHGQHPYRTNPLETTYDARTSEQIGFIGVASLQNNYYFTQTTLETIYDARTSEQIGSIV
jgi:hypothetical protein